jgi:hypothetical protein
MDPGAAPLRGLSGMTACFREKSACSSSRARRDDLRHAWATCPGMARFFARLERRLPFLNFRYEFTSVINGLGKNCSPRTGQIFFKAETRLLP